MDTAKDTYTSGEIAAALTLTERAVQIRAKREAWPSQPRPGRGGGKLYPLATLPEDVRAALRLAQAKAVETAPAPRHAATDAIVPDWSWNKAKARLRLVSEWREYVARQSKAGVAVRSATQAFLLAYSSGQLLPRLRGALGDVSLPTLYRWDKTARESGRDVEALADKRGGWANGRKKGLGQIAEEAQQAFLAAYLMPNQPSMALAHKTMEEALLQAGIPAPTYSSVRRWFLRFDAQNHDLVVFRRKGMKALEDTVGPYLSRDDRLLRVGDVLVSDGHRMNFQVINPETGKPQRMTLVGWQDWASRMFVAFEIMPDENTQAISSSLFRAIQNLGKLPGAVYLDNGRAFSNEYFSGSADMAENDGLYMSLGINVLHSMPYVARTKIIERWWGDFDRQCSRLMDSYVGSSIDNKPAHLHRNERWHKTHHSDRVPTLEEAKRVVTEFARWKASQPHPTRPGETPLDVFMAGRGAGFSADKLAELSRHFLYRREVTPQRCRIRMLGCEFEADFLYGINKKLTAHYSYADLSQVWIYDEGRLLGVARPVATVHPLAAQLGTEFDLEHLRAKQKENAALKRDTLRLANAMTAEYGPEAASPLAQMPYMLPLAERRTPFAPAKDRPALEPTPEISDQERRALEDAQRKALEAQKNRPAYEPRDDFRTPFDRYVYLFHVEVEQGIPLTDIDAAWARKFEQTEEYATIYSRRFEPLRKLFRKTA